jgi:hypothetical protein
MEGDVINSSGERQSETTQVFFGISPPARSRSFPSRFFSDNFSPTIGQTES